jgi:hypothetical protein
MVERCNRTFQEVLWYFEEEVDLDTMNSPTSKGGLKRCIIGQDHTGA